MLSDPAHNCFLGRLKDGDVRVGGAHEEAVFIIPYAVLYNLVSSSTDTSSSGPHNNLVRG